MNRTITLILVLLVAASCPHAASAKSFELSKFHADIKVLDDGTLRVTESLTYRFDGRYTYAFRTIPLRPGVNIDGLEISEGGQQYAGFERFGWRQAALARLLWPGAAWAGDPVPNAHLRICGWKEERGLAN
jgi:hypothetical protein